MTLTPASLPALADSWLGRSHYPADPTLAAQLSEFHVWSRVLTAAEITSLQSARAAATAVRNGDVVAYPLTESNAGTIADASGRNRPAVLRRTWGRSSHPGFLAAYPETQFITLETMTRSQYTVVWAPYYTAHKILKGLVDAHAWTRDARAIDLASGLCDWMYSRLSRLPAETRQRMWSIFSSGEFGGVGEAILDTYAVTRKAEHLELAKLFNLESLITACAENRDVLNGLHGNQHIPIFVGLIRLYEATNELRYLTAARNFWGMVVPGRMFAIGGTSNGEFFRAAGVVAGTISATSAETCCAHNMLKLSRSLFRHCRDPRFMDYYERTLYNQILGSKHDVADAEMPLMTYFIGLTPGAVRDFTPKAGTTCCEGTGLESATKYQDSIYLALPNDLYVNLYSPSTLRWHARNFTITQTTNYPYGPSSTLRVTGSGRFVMHLRIPSWVRRGATVTVNGTPTGTPVAGTYLPIDRTWANGDTVVVTFPLVLCTEQTPDRPTLQALMYGPLNLVAKDNRTTQIPISVLGRSGLSGDLSSALTPVANRPLHFTIGGIEFAPFFEGTTDRFHSYVLRNEPTVVWAGSDTGVANRANSVGRTLLDEVWSAAPFASKQAFVDRVTTVAGTWQGAGLLSQSERDTVVARAEAANLAA